MKKILLAIIACSAIGLASCNSDKKSSNSEEYGDIEAFELPPPPPSIELDEEAEPEEVVTSQEPAISKVEQVASLNAPQPAVAPKNNKIAANPYANLKGLNPAHGQPNHRCDIEVGEPLNTPPKSNSVAANTPAPTIQPNLTTTNLAPAPPAAPVEQTAPGFSGKANPPHGQPGHRCDISVGAILP